MDFEEMETQELKATIYDLIVQEERTSQKRKRAQDELAQRQQDEMNLDAETGEDSDESEE